jgi:hypothetical protein
MAIREVLGLYRDLDSAVAAADALRDAGFSRSEFEVLSNAPYPEGTFGEESGIHRLFLFPLIGAACGFAAGLLITGGTQLSYPLLTGGKPLLSIPPMLIIMYEGTMLGALIFTVLGVLFESRLPWIGRALYDPRITQGYIGILVHTAPEREAGAIEALRKANPEDILTEEGPVGQQLVRN